MDIIDLLNEVSHIYSDSEFAIVFDDIGVMSKFINRITSLGWNFAARCSELAVTFSMNDNVQYGVTMMMRGHTLSYYRIDGSECLTPCMI
jgi:hypothetical protein